MTVNTDGPPLPRLPWIVATLAAFPLAVTGVAVTHITREFLSLASGNSIDFRTAMSGAEMFGSLAALGIFYGALKAAREPRFRPYRWLLIAAAAIVLVGVPTGVLSWVGTQELLYVAVPNRDHWGTVELASHVAGLGVGIPLAYLSGAMAIRQDTSIQNAKCARE